MPDRPVIAAIGCGGTISSLGRDSTDVLDYPDFGTKLPIDEVLGRYPELAKVADMLPVPFRSVGSTAIGPPEWLELAATIDRLAAERPELAGFVIPHGTATLEETAYFLNLALKSDKTVVVVGAQRPASALGSDAGMNLLGAVRTVSAPAARGLGVLVVLNDEIHSAREATKTSTYRLQTFRSPDFGLLGHIDGDGVQIYRQPRRRHAPDTEFDIAGLARLPRVDIAYSYGGADGTVVDALVAAGARGIVSAGLAPGIPAPLERIALERARGAGVIVVQSSRAGSGRVALRRYLDEAGMVAADNLNPQKARILLMLALTRTTDIIEMRRMFTVY
ncbi:MAG TPA: asparaginase [Xanthobacteraceae bacterium]|jgi:L-asparaginase|nr:asparaginase [Xanthobacteraceae bacterium]